MNMEELNISPSPKTPEVKMDAQAGQLMIGGRSIPENSVEFYAKVLSWLDEYSSTQSGATVMDVKLEYFNTSSSKCILDIFKKLELMKKDREARVAEIKAKK